VIVPSRRIILHKLPGPQLDHFLLALVERHRAAADDRGLEWRRKRREE
jgi:hypothetical protein